MQNTEVYVKVKGGSETLKVSREMENSEVFITTDTDLPGSLAIVETWKVVKDQETQTEQEYEVLSKQLALFAEGQWEWALFKNPSGCWVKAASRQ